MSRAEQSRAEQSRAEQSRAEQSRAEPLIVSEPDGNLARVHVALSVYDPKGTYSQHAGVVMTSIFENTRNPVTVHVLHDDTLTEDNRRKLLRTAEKYSQAVDFVDVTESRRQLRNDIVKFLKTCVVSSPGTLYRFFIPGLLHLSRIIYLDCDVLVNMDIRELWELNMEKNCLAGVLDGELGKNRFRALRNKLNGGSSESHVNAGVLLMDLSQIRSRGDLFQLAADWLTRHMHSANRSDQDALNSLFFGSIKLIDERFNNYHLNGDLSNSIVHTWGHKPWTGLVGFPSDALYWKMYLRSAWGEGKSADEMVEILNDAAMTSLYPRLYASLPRKLINSLRYRFTHNELLSVLLILMKEPYYRLKYRR